MPEQVSPTTEPEPNRETRTRWVDDDGTIENFEQAFEQKPEIAYYQCPFCEYAAERERTIRAHINREEEGNHENKNGFMDVFVHAYDKDNEKIAEVKAPGSLQPTDYDNITDDFLPTGVKPDSRSAEIIKWAIANPTMSEQDIADEVYEKDTGPSYVYRVLDDNLLSDAKAAQQKPGQEMQRSWNDLTDKQQTFIAEYLHDEDRPMAKIENAADVSGGYGQRTLDKYEDVVNQARELVESGDLNLDEYRDIDEGEESEAETESSGKTWDDLTENQQAVITSHIENPDKPKIHIDDEVGMSQGYTSRTLSKYADIVEARRAELGKEVEPEPEADEEEETEVTWTSEDEDVPDEIPLAENAATRGDIEEISAKLSKLEASVSERVDAVSKRVDEVEAGLNDRIDAVEEGAATQAQTQMPSAEVSERDGVELDDEQWTVVVRTLAKHLDESDDDVLMNVISQV